MFQDTRPADLGAESGTDPWGDFRVGDPRERLRLLRDLRDGGTPINLNAPDGGALAVTLWTVDEQLGRLNFATQTSVPQVDRLIDADEAVAVAYLESVKLQFDLSGFTMVRGQGSAALQCALPREIYRFQRRSAYRVRPRGHQVPAVSLRHPALPEMQLNLRVLDLSIGGCALWLPQDVPSLQAGTRFATVTVALDAEARFEVGLSLQHVSAQGEGGARLGCEWQGLSSAAERLLQRWIDRSQQRSRLLTLR